MSWRELIEQELVKASEGLKNGNDGLARVCARRAVAIASQHWAEQRNLTDWQGDAMHHLHRIQEETTFPYSVREAAQRLLTKVTEQAQSPMTTDPITDAHIILNHLDSGT
jgi:phage shock protein A